MKAVFLALVLVALGARAGEACSAFIFRCPTSGNVAIAGHTFDRQNDVGLHLLALPRGYSYTALPLCKACPPQNFTFPLAAVWLSVSTDRVVGSPVQGMNEAGLAVGGHTSDFQLPARWAYQPDATPFALAWPDLMPYLLGNFETVAQVADFLNPEEVQVTTDFYSPAVRKAMGDLGLAPKDKTGGEGPLEVPIHISLFDATGEGGLIEFERDKGWVVYRNVTAVTNMPGYPKMQENLERWLEDAKNKSAQTASDFGDVFEAVFDSYPGGYGSESRFIRLNMLVDKVCTLDPTPWPAEPNWSAGFAGVEDSPGRAALAQAEGILRTVDIVRGAIKFGGFTEAASLRDLTNGMFYWKTPLTNRWQGLNLTAIAESAVEPLVLPIFSGWEAGWEDVTAQLAPLPVSLGTLSPEQARLLGPLINGSAAAV